MKNLVVNQPVVGENRAERSGAETPDAPLTTTLAVRTSDDMAAHESTEKSPAFQFYTRDFLSDSNVVGMSMQERGVYITLICLCWQDGSIPSDAHQLARLCGTPPRAFIKFWPAVERCFRKSGASRLIHPRLERERAKQAEWRGEQSDRGKRGAAARWKKDGASIPTPSPKNGGATVSPMAKNGSSSALCSLQSSSSDFSQQQQANARSKRPIYTSDRFAVFEWQLDELSKMLGAHYEAFDLHGFFDALSQQSRTSGLVIPKAESWPWLQAQVLAEAKRRELPMASAVPVRDRAAENRVQDERILAEIQEARRAGR